MRSRLWEWMRRVGWVSIGVAVMVPGLWVVVQARLAATPEAFNRWVGWANVFALPVGGLGVALVVFEKAATRRTPPVQPGPDVGQALADLARRLEQDWSTEAVRREVIRPAPVLVSWSSSGRRGADRAVVLNETGTTWQQMPLRGQLDGLNEAIVDAFRELPHRQLVVLGDPGAGKSVFAMLLTLGLIRRPDPGAGLPVLLPINVWDPSEPVAGFVARRLAEDYADVLVSYGDPAALARRLVEHRQILPVLDGLDELPAQAQARAVEALDEYAAPGCPLVVTCRIGEYERAVARGRVLSRAAVIELEPVGVEAAISYLSQPATNPLWAPVFEYLRAHPDGPLAQALSTPLMIALARTAYHDSNTPQADPADLLSFTTAQQITGRLMDAFLTTAYTHPPAPTATTSRRPLQVSPEQARRWLGTLAYHLDQAGTHDLHWWQIPPDLLTARPQRVRTLTVAAAAMIAAVVAGVLACVMGNGWTAGRAAIAAAVIVLVGASGWLRPLWPHGYGCSSPSGTG